MRGGKEKRRGFKEEGTVGNKGNLHAAVTQILIWLDAVWGGKVELFVSGTRLQLSGNHDWRWDTWTTGRC